MIIFDNTPEDRIVFTSEEAVRMHTINPCMCGTMPVEDVERNEKFVTHRFICPKCGFFSECIYDIYANRYAKPTTFTAFRFDSIILWNRSVKDRSKKRGDRE